MARHDGGTHKPGSRKHMGHRVHKRTRAARRAQARASRRTPTGWSPSMRYDDSLGQWVL